MDGGKRNSMTDQTRVHKPAESYQKAIEAEILIEHPGAYCEIHKSAVFKEMLKDRGLTNPSCMSKKPDIVIFDDVNRIMRVIEVKHHNNDIKTRGSADEKFETALYKHIYYNDIANTNNYTATYEFIANKRHDRPKTREALLKQNTKITFIGD